MDDVWNKTAVIYCFKIFELWLTMLLYLLVMPSDLSSEMSTIMNNTGVATINIRFPKQTF